MLNREIIEFTSRDLTAIFGEQSPVKQKLAPKREALSKSQLIVQLTEKQSQYQQRLAEVPTKLSEYEKAYATLTSLLWNADSLKDKDGKNIFKRLSRFKNGQPLNDEQMADKRAKQLLRRAALEGESFTFSVPSDDEEFAKQKHSLLTDTLTQNIFLNENKLEIERQKRTRAYYRGVVNTTQKQLDYLNKANIEETNKRLQQLYLILHSAREAQNSTKATETLKEVAEIRAQLPATLARHLQRHREDPEWLPRDYLNRSLVSAVEGTSGEGLFIKLEAIQSLTGQQETQQRSLSVEEKRPFLGHLRRNFVRLAVMAMIASTMIPGLKELPHPVIAASSPVSQESVTIANISSDRLQTMSDRGVQVTVDKQTTAPATEQTSAVANEQSPAVTSVDEPAVPKNDPMIQPAPVTTIHEQTNGEVNSITVEPASISQINQPAKVDEEKKAQQLVAEEQRLVDEKAAQKAEQDRAAKEETDGKTKAEVVPTSQTSQEIKPQSSISDEIVNSSKGPMCGGEWRALVKKYFQSNWVDTFLRIGEAESTCRWWAISPGGDYGFLQVNKIHIGSVKDQNLDNLLNPDENVRIAAEIFQEEINAGRVGTGPWSVCTKHIANCTPDK